MYYIKIGQASSVGPFMERPAATEWAKRNIGTLFNWSVEEMLTPSQYSDPARKPLAQPVQGFIRRHLT